MGQILIRNVPDDIKTALKQRAAKHGVSMEAEARAILERAVQPDEAAGAEFGLGTRIAALFKDCGFREGEFQRINDPARVITFDE